MPEPIIITIPEGRDAELWVAEDIIQRLNGLTAEQAIRVAAYIAARFHE